MLIELFLLSGASAYWLTSKLAPVDSVQTSHPKGFSPIQLFKDVKSAISGDERQQQLSACTELSKEKQKDQHSLNRHILLSAYSMHTSG